MSSESEDDKKSENSNAESFSDDKEIAEKVSMEHSLKKMELEKSLEKSLPKIEEKEVEQKTEISKEILKEDKIEEEKDSDESSSESKKIVNQKKQEKQQNKNKNEYKKDENEKEKGNKKKEKNLNEEKERSYSSINSSDKKNKINEDKNEDSNDKDRNNKKEDSKIDSSSDHKQKKIKEKSKDKEVKKGEKKKDSDSSSYSSESDNKKYLSKEKKENSLSVVSEDKKKEDEDKKKKEKEERKKRENEEKEKERKERDDERKRRREINMESERNHYERNNYNYGNNRYGNQKRFNHNYNPFNNGNQNQYENKINYTNNNNNYIQKRAKKFDLNEINILKKIISENIEIITEMKNIYPELTQFELASIFKIIKNSNEPSQTIFEIMNRIHREISIQITLNEYNNKNSQTYRIPIEPFEIIDPLYSNQEHIKILKYYQVYSKQDIEKLPKIIKEKLTPDFYYTNKMTRRRKLIKYSNGSFNYIPIICENIDKCENENCPYSNTYNEMYFHPLFYKTRYYNENSKGNLSKTANDYFNDFRIIYNYKNQNVINLLKLLEEKKIAKSYYKDFIKEIKSFSLETFKTKECPFLKSGIACPKDTHLCYFFHKPNERRRPPTLYRYSNEMCPNIKFKKNGNIKSDCKNGDFCNKCHSKYEYNYHKLFFGKAITCIRDKKNGKCIYEETCYGYHSYKEKGYKKTKEEIIKEKKDELMDKYTEEFDLLNGLINKYKCQSCSRYSKKFKYCLLINCGHIICHKCFKDLKHSKCPICKEKFDSNKNNKYFFVIDIKNSAKDIDKLIKTNYKEKKEGKNEKEVEYKNIEEIKDKKEEKSKEFNKNVNNEKEDMRNDKENNENDMKQSES